MASVEEPHIIPVYGAGEVDGVLYIATKFVSGGDLADVLQRAGGVLEPRRAAMFIEQVASALDAAHAAGLVHRDVKLSKQAMAVSGLTATGTFLGTPDYCAPEQIKGLPVDGRCDQYSLACMAFALLTGNLPFRRPLRGHRGPGRGGGIRAPDPAARARLKASHRGLMVGSWRTATVKTCGKGRTARVAEEGLEMTVMARVEHVGKGFEREREDKESRGHEHSTKDHREDRGEDKGDE